MSFASVVRVRSICDSDGASGVHRTIKPLLFQFPVRPVSVQYRHLDAVGRAAVRAARWTALSLYLDPAGGEGPPPREPVASPFHDRAVHCRLIQGEDEGSVTTDLDRGIDAARGSADLESDAATVASAEEEARDAVLLDALATEIDLDAGALRDTLETAMAVPRGRPQLRVAEEPGFYRVLRPDLPGWRDVIDESVRRPAPGGASGGPMPRLAFSPEPFIERLGRLSVFQPRRDALLMHLAHPMMQRALGVLTRRRYPGGPSEVSRWTVRLGDVPEGVDADRLAEMERSIEEKQKELARRQLHYEEIRGQLQREPTRILEHLLPARFRMAGDAQAIPVALEIRLPEQRT